MEQPVVQRFFCAGELLFELNAATDYDTANPYRYAVNRLIELAERIRLGQPVTVISRTVPERTAVLQTVDQLRAWVAAEFNQPGNGGFDR